MVSSSFILNSAFSPTLDSHFMTKHYRSLACFEKNQHCCSYLKYTRLTLTNSNYYADCIFYSRYAYLRYISTKNKLTYLYLNPYDNKPASIIPRSHRACFATSLPLFRSRYDHFTICPIVT